MLVVRSAEASKFALFEEERTSIEAFALKFVALLLGVVDRDIFWGVVFAFVRAFKFVEVGLVVGTLGLFVVV